MKIKIGYYLPDGKFCQCLYISEMPDEVLLKQTSEETEKQIQTHLINFLRATYPQFFKDISEHNLLKNLCYAFTPSIIAHIQHLIAVKKEALESGGIFTQLQAISHAELNIRKLLLHTRYKHSILFNQTISTPAIMQLRSKIAETQYIIEELRRNFSTYNNEEQFKSIAIALESCHAQMKEVVSSLVKNFSGEIVAPIAPDNTSTCATTTQTAEKISTFAADNFNQQSSPSQDICTQSTASIAGAKIVALPSIDEKKLKKDLKNNARMCTIAAFHQHGLDSITTNLASLQITPPRIPSIPERSPFTAPPIEENVTTTSSTSSASASQTGYVLKPVEPFRITRQYIQLIFQNQADAMLHISQIHQALTPSKSPALSAMRKRSSSTTVRTFFSHKYENSTDNAVASADNSAMAMESMVRQTIMSAKKRRTKKEPVTIKAKTTTANVDDELILKVDLLRNTITLAKSDYDAYMQKMSPHKTQNTTSIAANYEIALIEEVVSFSVSGEVANQSIPQNAISAQFSFQDMKLALSFLSTLTNSHVHQDKITLRLSNTTLHVQVYAHNKESLELLGQNAQPSDQSPLKLTMSFST